MAGFDRRHDLPALLESDGGLLGALGAAVVATDPVGMIFYWNPAAERLYGYEPERTLGGNFMELLVGPDDRPRGAEILSQVLSGQRWTGEFPALCADGRTRTVWLTQWPLWQDRTVVGVLGTGDRVTGSHHRGADPVAAGRAVGQGWASLTEAELRVARLVAKGLTNQAIANRLWLSRHTVDSHVKHVFTKLDIRSRVQLTREVLTREPPHDV